MRAFGVLLVFGVAVWSAHSQPSRMSPEDKFYGGHTEQDTRALPYIAYMRYEVDGFPTFRCGGSLVTLTYVATACHCIRPASWQSWIDPKKLEKWTFIAGTVIDSTWNWELGKTAQIRSPQKLVQHPECDRTKGAGGGYDIALAKMTRRFEMTHYVRPVNVFFSDFELQLNNYIRIQNSVQTPLCVAAGWGYKIYVGLAASQGRSPLPGFVSPTPGPSEDPKLLKSAKLFLLTRKECVRLHILAFRNEVPTAVRNWAKFEKEITLEVKDQICAEGVRQGSVQAYEAPCSGDSGGPLVCNSSLFGVLSSAYGCGTSVPIIIQSLGRGMKWFQSQICEVVTCDDITTLHSRCPRPSPSTRRRLCGDRPPPSKAKQHSSTASMDSSFFWPIATFLAHI